MSYAYVFVLSGYVLKVEDNPNILGFANRKLKRLMLPYILFIAVSYTHLDVYKRQLQELSKDEDVIFTGYTYGDNLHQLYTHACLLYTSRCV